MLAAQISIDRLSGKGLENDKVIIEGMFRNVILSITSNAVIHFLYTCGVCVCVCLISRVFYNVPIKLSPAGGITP